MGFMGCCGSEVFSGKVPNYYQQAEKESKKKLFKKINVYDRIEHQYVCSFPKSRCQEEETDISNISGRQ